MKNLENILYKIGMVGLGFALGGALVVAMLFVGLNFGIFNRENWLLPLGIIVIVAPIVGFITSLIFYFIATKHNLAVQLIPENSSSIKPKRFLKLLVIAVGFVIFIFGFLPEVWFFVSKLITK